LEGTSDEDEDALDSSLDYGTTASLESSCECPEKYKNPALLFSLEENPESSSEEDDASSTQSEWDILLPAPAYGEVTKYANFSSLEKLLSFIEDLEPIVQKQLEEHNYDAIGAFVKFYQAYQQCREVPMETFFREYEALITPEHYTCVGLSLDLLNKIQSNLCLTYPGITSKLFVASCEEEYTGALSDYTRFSPPPSYFVLKEHVMVILKICVEGRRGCLILDPGYHVSNAIVVMEDAEYPHTGWFVQSETSKLRKEYCYEMANDQYVLWQERNTRGTAQKLIKSLIYIHQKFENYVDYTERRNLVYHFRVLVKRNRKGQLLSGVYFPLNPQGSFTIFSHNVQSGLREDCKIPFVYFHSNSSVMDGDGVIEKAIKACGESLNIANFRQLLAQLSCIVDDAYFLAQVLHIDTLLEEDD